MDPQDFASTVQNEEKTEKPNGEQNPPISMMQNESGIDYTNNTNNDNNNNKDTMTTTSIMVKTIAQTTTPTTIIVNNNNNNTIDSIRLLQ